MSQQILIACIGNIFLGDDGFGVEASRALSAADLGDDVMIVDFGIRGLDLAYALLQPWETVILVDAIARGGAPGTLYVLQPAEAGGTEERGFDPHSMDPVRVLATARSLGEVSAEIYIVGCEPLDFGDELEGRMSLSPAVAASIPETVKVVRNVLSNLREDAAMAAS